MGYDSFGLPAEQYIIQTGQRPEDTTSVNIDGGFDKRIAGYRKQLDKIGFHSIGAESELQIGLLQTYPMDFIQLFNSWYNKQR
jgi:leucyl-tRNA synthetase